MLYRLLQLCVFWLFIVFGELIRAEDDRGSWRCSGLRGVVLEKCVIWHQIARWNFTTGHGRLEHPIKFRKFFEVKAMPLDEYLRTSEFKPSDIAGFIGSEGGLMGIKYTPEAQAPKILGTLEPQLALLPNLVYLDLQGNQISGTLPSAWGSSPSLVQIFLSNNQVTGELPDTWNSLGNAITMRYMERPQEPMEQRWTPRLHLDGNKLHGTLPETWGSMDRAQVIQLADNMLTGTLPEVWANITFVRTLNLSHNLLTGPLPATWLGPRPWIQHLDLSHNLISGQLPVKIDDMEMEDTAIKRALPLSHPQQMLLMRMGNLQLPPSSIEQPAAKEGFAEDLLQSLSPDNKRYLGQMAYQWTGFDTMRTLWLSYNEISGPLPPEWHSMMSLRDLRLDHNHLSGNLPVEWKEMSAIHVLYLNDNHFSGDLPDAWGLMTGLTELHLQHNNITGELPGGWSTMRNMEDLDVSHNLLEGSLPETWGAWCLIRKMYLSNNSLSGTLPSKWSEMRSIMVIHLDNNMLEGSLPPIWGELRSLVQLSLHHNLLTGALPPEYGGMTNITILSLSRNRLSHHLPESYYKLRHLIHMNLSNNPLQGDIPVRWCDIGGHEQNSQTVGPTGEVAPRVWVDLTNTSVGYSFGPMSTREEVCKKASRNKAVSSKGHVVLLTGASTLPRERYITSNPFDQDTMCADSKASWYVAIAWGTFLMLAAVLVIIQKLAKSRAPALPLSHVVCCLALVKNHWYNRWVAAMYLGKALIYLGVTAVDVASDLYLFSTLVPRWPAWIVLCGVILPEVICSCTLAKYWATRTSHPYAVLLALPMALLLVPLFPLLVVMLVLMVLMGRQGCLGVDVVKLSKLQSGVTAATEAMFTSVFTSVGYAIMTKDPGALEGVFVTRMSFWFSLVSSMFHMLFSWWALLGQLKQHGTDLRWLARAFHDLGTGKEKGDDQDADDDQPPAVVPLVLEPLVDATVDVLK